MFTVKELNYGQTWIHARTIEWESLLFAKIRKSNSRYTSRMEKRRLSIRHEKWCCFPCPSEKSAPNYQRTMLNKVKRNGKLFWRGYQEGRSGLSVSRHIREQLSGWKLGSTKRKFVIRKFGVDIVRVATAKKNIKLSIKKRKSLKARGSFFDP